MVLPLVEQLGINLVHFAVIVILNIMIGLSIPPFGMLLFIVSGISNTPLTLIIKEILPMV
jgi:TRAP-type C4-dicarboxylate transport system permease large subunit